MSQGVAKNCRMQFEFASDGEGGCNVKMEIGYDPTNPLATAAAPLLRLDSQIALKLLLKRALPRSLLGP